MLLLFLADGPIGYYEAIFQFRNCSSEVLGYSRKLIDKQGGHVVKIVEQKNGGDFYLDSWRLAVFLGKRLKKVFSGETKISRKLFGVSRIKSKKVYRVTVLFRCLKSL